MDSCGLLILGVTASGKGRLAFDLAENLGAEIISVDSMKVYRRMDIGTAKPPGEARQRVRYHMIDVVEPSEPFNVGSFLDLAYDAAEQIKGRGKKIIAVGGTALYIKALLYGLKGPVVMSKSALNCRPERMQKVWSSCIGNYQRLTLPRRSASASETASASFERWRFMRLPANRFRAFSGSSMRNGRCITGR